MKKITFLLLTLAMSFGIYAQSNNDYEVSKKNEMKLNLPLTIFASYPEVSYERVLNMDISVGASLGVGLDEKRAPMDFAFTPYFRWFFGGNRKSMEKAGTGFFIEANGALFSANKNSAFFDDNNDETKNKSKFGAGLGLGVGWKYLSRNNWVGEICYGIGRDFIKERAYPHIGISIGKRF